jgi:hypothetical protein
MRIGPQQMAPMTGVACHLAGVRATCTGHGVDGSFVATQSFTIKPDGSLVPWCPPGSGMPTIYCAR